MHPELAQLAGAAPGVPADPRHDALALAHNERERFAISDVRGARVELVDPIFQVLQIIWRRVDWSQRDLAHFFARLLPPCPSSLIEPPSCGMTCDTFKRFASEPPRPSAHDHRSD